MSGEFAKTKKTRRGWLTGVKAALVITVVTAIPLFFAGRGVFAFFTDDDLLNLYGHWTLSWRELVIANIKFWSPVYRPLGGLAYKGLFEIYGFNPLPFRVACFALMLVNLGLTYRLAARLSRSHEIGALTVLIACYHVGFTDLYYNTGTIYDLLCFLFYFLALLVYIDCRLDGHEIGARRGAVFLGLYVCALNAKEMAVSMPLTILLFEVVYGWPAGARGEMRAWLRRTGAFVLLLCVLTIPYIQGKLSPASPFPKVPDYIPEIGVSRYFSNYGNYMDRMFYVEQGWFSPARLACVMLLVALLCLVLKRKSLVFAALFIFSSVGPVIFIAPRGTIFVLYITFFGWALFIASTIVAARGRAIRTVRGQEALQVATFIAVGVIAVSAHQKNGAKPHVRGELEASYRQFRALAPAVKAGGRVLLLHDPFSRDEWTPLFLLRLLHRDPLLAVDRAKMMDKPPTHAEVEQYDVVLDWNGVEYVRRP